jgi:hypothetical protein
MQCRIELRDGSSCAKIRENLNSLALSLDLQCTVPT